MLGDNSTEQFARRLVAIAQKDLKAARLLYRKNFYPQAVFFFQQGVEKGYKAFALHSAVIREKKMDEKPTIRDVSHTPTKITCMSLEQSEKKSQKVKPIVDAVPEVKEVYAKLGVDYEEYLRQRMVAKEYISDISKRPQDYRDLNSDDLDNVLARLFAYSEDFDAGRRSLQQIKLNAETKETMKRELLNSFEPLKGRCPGIIESVKLELDKAFESEMFSSSRKYQEFLLFCCESVYVSLILNDLSIVTQPHESSSRYPVGNIHPTQYYTKELPLIVEFIPLLAYAERATKMLMKIVDYAERLQGMKKAGDPAINSTWQREGE